MVGKMMRVLVENLPRDLVEGEMNDLFDKFGRVTSFQLKFASRNSAIAFIEYTHPQEAEAAYHGLHGSTHKGSRLQAELWHPSDSTQRMQDKTMHRMLVAGLPPTVTANETRELVVTTGSDVLGLQIDRRGNAWASFPTHYELDNAMRKLDDTVFRGERIRAMRAEPDDMSNAVTTTKPSSASASGSSHTTVASPTARTSSSSSTRARSDSRSTRSRSRSRGRSPARGPSPRRYRGRSPSRSPSRHRRSRSRSRSRR